MPLGMNVIKQERPGPFPIWLLILGVAVIGSNSLALSPILSDVAADLEASPVAVARANAAYGGATAMSAVCLGRSIDRLGAERVLCAGFAALSCAMLGSAVATHWMGLALAQSVAGLAAGVMLPATYSLAAAVAPKGREAETLGRVLTGWSLSLVFGVPASAYVASALSWRASYVAFAAMLAVAGILLALQPRRVEKAPAGATMWEALRRPGVGTLLAICLLFMTAFYGVYAYLGDHLRTLLGLNATKAGFVVLAYGAGFGLAMFADGLVDRIGPARLFPLVLACIALVYAAMIPAAAAFTTILCVSALWGFTNHLGLNILVLRLTRIGAECRGSVLALNSATSYAGALVGTWLFGLIYEGIGFEAVAVAAALCAGLAAMLAIAEGRSNFGSAMTRPIG